MNNTSPELIAVHKILTPEGEAAFMEASERDPDAIAEIVEVDNSPVPMVLREPWNEYTDKCAFGNDCAARNFFTIFGYTPKLVKKFIKPEFHLSVKSNAFIYSMVPSIKRLCDTGKPLFTEDDVSKVSFYLKNDSKAFAALSTGIVVTPETGLILEPYPLDSVLAKEGFNVTKYQAGCHGMVLKVEMFRDCETDGLSLGLNKILSSSVSDDHFINRVDQNDNATPTQGSVIMTFTIAIDRSKTTEEVVDLTSGLTSRPSDERVIMDDIRDVASRLNSVPGGTRKIDEIVTWDFGSAGDVGDIGYQTPVNPNFEEGRIDYPSSLMQDTVSELTAISQAQLDELISSGLAINATIGTPQWGLVAEEKLADLHDHLATVEIDSDMVAQFTDMLTTTTDCQPVEAETSTEQALELIRQIKDDPDHDGYDCLQTLLGEMIEK